MFAEAANPRQHVGCWCRVRTSSAPVRRQQPGRSFRTMGCSASARAFEGSCCASPGNPGYYHATWCMGLLWVVGPCANVQSMVGMHSCRSVGNFTRRVLMCTATSTLATFLDLPAACGAGCPQCPQSPTHDAGSTCHAIWHLVELTHPRHCGPSPTRVQIYALRDRVLVYREILERTSIQVTRKVVGRAQHGATEACHVP